MRLLRLFSLSVYAKKKAVICPKTGAAITPIPIAVTVYGRQGNFQVLG
jgi:hypothetical protein